VEPASGKRGARGGSKKEATGKKEEPKAMKTVQEEVQPNNLQVTLVS
jgi:hypothetical protein